MTRSELMELVKDELTGSCALPYSIPDREMERIINQALNWFYLNYQYAVETQYYVVNKGDFTDKEFTKTRSVLLPNCVIAVVEVKEINGGSRLGTIDKDFSDNRLIASELFLSPFQSDDLVLRTAQYSYWDLTQAFFLERLSYDYNQNTKRMKILGRNPKKDVFIQTMVKIEESNLYDDWIFQRYVTAQSKISLGRILGFFQYNLPGGVAVNADSIKEEGKEELEEIKAKIDSDSTTDWFLIFHSFIGPIIVLGTLLNL